MTESTHIETGIKKSTHKHHIIPKHMGGTDDPNNLIELTAEEHAEAHRILYEKYGKWQDRIAWQSLSGLIGKEDIQAEKARASILSRNRSAEEWKKGWQTRRKNGKDRPSEETKKKQSLAMKGKKKVPFSVKHKENIAKATKKMHEEGRLGTYPNHAGTKWWNNGKINKRAKDCPGSDFIMGKLK